MTSSTQPPYLQERQWSIETTVNKRQRTHGHLYSTKNFKITETKKKITVYTNRVLHWLCRLIAPSSQSPYLQERRCSTETTVNKRQRTHGHLYSIKKSFK